MEANRAGQIASQKFPKMKWAHFKGLVILRPFWNVLLVLRFFGERVLEINICSTFSSSVIAFISCVAIQ